MEYSCLVGSMVPNLCCVSDCGIRIQWKNGGRLELVCLVTSVTIEIHTEYKWECDYVTRHHSVFLGSEPRDTSATSAVTAATSATSPDLFICQPHCLLPLLPHTNRLVLLQTLLSNCIDFAFSRSHAMHHSHTLQQAHFATWRTGIKSP